MKCVLLLFALVACAVTVKVQNEDYSILPKVKILHFISSFSWQFLYFDKKNGIENEVLLCVFNPFHPSVAFHIYTSHLICCANQMTCFYIK